MSTNKTNRQYPKVAMVDLGIANIGASNGVNVKLPQGALVKGVGVQVHTAFNSATTTTVSVGDGDAATTFVNAQDAKTAGAKTVAASQKFYPTGGEVNFTMAETGAAATAGRAIGWVEYVQLNVGNEVYGND